MTGLDSKAAELRGRCTEEEACEAERLAAQVKKGEITLEQAMVELLTGVRI